MSDNKDKKAEEKLNKQEEDSSKVVDKQEVKEDEPTTEQLLAEEKDRFLRLFAEFENYKKRTAKERLELFKTANRELMSALLPVLDDFDRALAEIKKSDDDDHFKGVKLIADKFKKTLEQKGLTKMKVKSGDAFDADRHQAITQIPAPSKKLKGKIIDVTEQGYTLGDTIIRFPKVVVGN